MPTSRANLIVAAIIWAVIVLVGWVGGVVALTALMSIVVDDPILRQILINVIAGLAIGLVWIMRPRWIWGSEKQPNRARLNAPATWWFGMVGVVLAAFVAGQLLANQLYAQVGSDAFDAQQQVRAAAAPAAVLLLSLVFAPVGEESLLRGLLYPLLRQRLPIIFSVIASSLVFAVLHGNVIQIVYTLPMGITLALVMEKTRALWLCILLHAAMNLLSNMIDPSLIARLSVYGTTPFTIIWIVGVAWLYVSVARTAPPKQIAFS